MPPPIEAIARVAPMWYKFLSDDEKLGRMVDSLDSVVFAAGLSVGCVSCAALTKDLLRRLTL